MILKDIQMAANGEDIASFGGYTEGADRLGPVFDGATYLWPYLLEAKGPDFPLTRPDYQAAFVNTSGASKDGPGLDPRQFRSEARLSVTFQGGFAFTEMPVGSVREVEANAGFAVYPGQDCMAPGNVGIGLALQRRTDDGSLPAVVTRLSEDQWTIEVSQSVRTYESGARLRTYQQGKKTKWATLQ